MSFRGEWKREIRIARSRRAQPTWFRIVKWTIAIVAGAYAWQTPYFWQFLGGALTLSLVVHFLWRWKTKGWTRPWGGWDDIEAGRDPTRVP